MSQAMHMPGTRHDENAFSHSAGLQAKQSSTSQQASKPLGSAAKPLQSVRKAFGNITNTKGDGGAEQQQHTAHKRRAFGDLTNSTAKPSALKALPSKPPATTSKLHTGASSSHAAPLDTQAAQAASSSGAELALAAEGVERFAGKTWAELEAEREQQEEDAINKSVSSIVRGLVGGSWPLGRLQVLQDTSTQEEELLEADDDCKGLSSLLSSAPQAQSSGAATTSSSDNLDGDGSSLWDDHIGTDDVNSLLPDVPIISSPISNKAHTPDEAKGPSSRMVADVQQDSTAASPAAEPW